MKVSLSSFMPRLYIVPCKAQDTVVDQGKMPFKEKYNKVHSGPHINMS